MSKTTYRFEDLHCWKAARKLAHRVFIICKTGELSKDWDTRSQLKRAAVSVMNNIAEGHGRFSDPDSIKFLDYAKASGNEVKSMFYLLEDVGYVSDSLAVELRKMADDAINLTGGYIRFILSKKKE